MKSIVYFLLVMSMACKPAPYTEQHAQQAPEPSPEVPLSKEDATPPNRDRSQYYTTLDSVKMEGYDEEYYSREEYNAIVDEHPEFFESYADYPDELYSCGMSHGRNFSEKFGSEAGQDGYYLLYSHFVKKQHGAGQYKECREKLISIYNDINTLFRHFEYGGTYFGHQEYRILAYAEYSVGLYKSMEGLREKTYDITKQKHLYIQTLRQLIKDESSNDENVFGREKAERTKKLHEIVDRLERSITDVFYLRRAQEFHYRHYEYH